LINSISPSGNLYLQDSMPTLVNAMVVDPQELGNIPTKPGRDVHSPLTRVVPGEGHRSIGSDIRDRALPS